MLSWVGMTTRLFHSKEHVAIFPRLCQVCGKASAPMSLPWVIPAIVVVLSLPRLEATHFLLHLGPCLFEVCHCASMSSSFDRASPGKFAFVFLASSCWNSNSPRDGVRGRGSFLGTWTRRTQALVSSTLSLLPANIDVIKCCCCGPCQAEININSQMDIINSNKCCIERLLLTSVAFSSCLSFY